eukprot:g14917.t1
MAILRGDVELAAAEARKAAQGLPFHARQCAQRAFLLYGSSQEEREAAILVSQKGEHFVANFNALNNTDGTSTNALDLLLQPTLWAPNCQQEFVRVDTTLKLARAAIYMKGSWWDHEQKEKGKEAVELERPGAVEYQLVGKTVVARLLCGRIAGVLQCFMGSKMAAKFHPRIFEFHIKAAKNFEEFLASPGPPGPLEEADPASYTDAGFEQWMMQREQGVAKQLQLISELVAEISVHMLQKQEAKMLLHAAKEFYKSECQDVKTLRRALKTFEATEEMI